jgi:hypothetical protein
VAVVLAAAALAGIVPAAGWLTAERLPTVGAGAGAQLRSLSSPRSERGAGVRRLDSLPAQAQSVMSTALGRDDPQFAPRRSAGGFRLAGGGVAVTLGNRQVTVRARGGRSSMGLSSVGRGGRLRPLGAVAPRTRLNRVTYRHRVGVSEWYAAGPLGVEQGFTVARSPVGGKGPLTLGLAARGSLRPRLSGSGAEFLTRSGRVALRYGGLTVLDASGRRLQAWLDVSRSGLLLRVADRDAQYPLLIDPFIQEGSKLLAPRNSFGFSVAVSEDGSTALIGGPTNGAGQGSLIGPAPAEGAAWVFVRSGSTWTQQGPKLTGSDESGNGWFGWSVALSGDGNTALIGGPADNDTGAAWVFTRSGSSWSQQGSKLTGSGRSGSGLFGWSVALSRDGSTALIGGPADNQAMGAAWVFSRSGSTWTQQGSKLTGAGSADGQFGLSVALSADGSTALIGGPADNGRVGAAWVFSRSGSTWTQQGSKLTGSGESGSADGQFGWSVALSADGNTALIGGPADNGRVGAAWVFTRSGSSWTQQGAKLAGSGESGRGLFGTSVALSGDGGTALIGGPLDNSTVGAAWVFTRTGSTWSQQGSKLTGSDASGVRAFGWSVALSGDGRTALVGGYFDNSTVGAAWVFVPSGSSWAQQGSKLTIASGENGSGQLGSSVALSGDGNVALMGAPGDSGNAGAAWIFTRSRGVWTDQEPKLTGAGETGAGQFGASVSLSSDGDTALIGGPADNGGRGAAWVFVRSGSTWTQQGSKLTGSDESGAGKFGASVALSEGGDTALIGGSADNGDLGAAWVFTRSGSTWTQQGSKLTGSGGSAGGGFGSSVALSRNGDVALAGAPFDNDEVGAAWVFARSGSTWTQQGSKLTGADETGDGRFGSGVALSEDGATALIGGPDDDDLVGAAWVFSGSGSTWTQQGSKLTGSSAGLFFGKSVALAADGRTALIGAYGDDNTVGAAWVFSRSGSTWTRQEPKLTPSDPNASGGSQFGYSVALSGDGRTALIGGPKDFGPFIFLPGSNSPPIVGAAWVFIFGDPPALTSSASATFTTGQRGSFTVAASGVPTPALSADLDLPAGVGFEDNGDGTATLSGTPAAGTGGVYRFVIIAANGVEPDAIQIFTLTVEQPPAITSAAATTFRTGQAGSFTVASSGFPAAALSVQGALPGGVRFTDNGDGTASLAGTPAAGTGGAYRVTITAANGVSPAATQEFTLTVAQPPALTSAATATFATGQAGSFTVTSSGFPAPALSVQGALPGGVRFTDNGDGTATFAGTPAAGTSGVYRLTITATNGASDTATQEFTLTVGEAPAITSAAAATFTTGQAGSFTLTSSGFPTPALSARGALPLPDGVSYTDNGDGTATLAGTPAAGTGGLYDLTITAANGVSPDATQEFTLTVAQPPAISPAGALFTTGRAGNFTITTSGFPAPALSVQGALPTGVRFTDSGDGTATLAGTPAAGTAGVYDLTITAANGVSPDATQVITLTVGQAPAITSAAAATFTTGQAGSFTLTSSGFPAPRLSADGSLPAGVHFTDNRDGTATLAGTPAAGAGGVYRLTITAANGISAAATQDFRLTVEQPPGITSAARATFRTGQAGSFTVASSGFPAVALSVEGALPAGVSFTDEGDGTATLAGTPAADAGGVYGLTITAANGVSSQTQEFTLTVEQPPAITSGARATFRTGRAGSFTVASSGFPAAALSVTGALPAGVSFTDEGDGTAKLAGTPDGGAGGVYRLTIAAGNGVSPEATQEFALTVAATPQPPPPSPPSASPSPRAPAPAILRLRALGRSVFGPAGSDASCQMRSGRVRACSVRLVRGGRVLAAGHAQRPVGVRRLTVALQLTKRGRALLGERLGGVRARLRARAVTSGGTRKASARTRALLQVERFSTPPGSWLPGEAALSESGQRFLRGLRGRLVAVVGLRCEGHSARSRGPAVGHGPLSHARAALLCRALARLAGDSVSPTVVGHGTAQPIATNDTDAGRAKNRRVVVTVRHRPRRLP